VNNVPDTDLDTVPRVLRRNNYLFGDRTAMRKKRFGIWQQYTWKDVYQHVTWICFGFLSLGLQKGDRVIIIGNNDPELFWIQWGVQCATGIPVCLYVDSLSEEVKYFINNSGAKFFVGEDQEQVDKMLAIKEDCPQMSKVIYWDEKGLWFYEEPNLIGISELEQLGKEEQARTPDRMDHYINETKGNDTSVIIYTSGTTGVPKGIIIPYYYVLFYPRNGFRTYRIPPGSEYFSYAPPAWAEQSMGLAIGPDYPMVISFAEEPETLQNDIMEIAPHMLFYQPRLWEDLARQIRMKIDDSPWWKRLSFQFALKEGYNKLEAQEQRRTLPILRKITWWIADRLVLSVARGHYGMKRVRLCTVGGTSCAPSLIRFFRALGVPLCNAYGSVEAGMLASLKQLETRYDTVGQPFPGVEVKIDENEILARSPGMAKEYWKISDGLSKKMEDGWYHTGDAGYMDEDGYLVVYDRLEEMIHLQGGAAFSPQFIETRLRFSLYVKDAIVFGDEDKPYLTAIISIDFGMVSKWAESRSIPYTTFVELSQKPEVLSLLAEEVRNVNKLLPQGGRIKKFVSLHKEFDPDEAELTRSRKLKRHVLNKKYEDIYRSVYENRQTVPIEAKVTYSDGREGKVSATLCIIEV
jgi:long-chain acyl-CoA synthetase